MKPSIAQALWAGALLCFILAALNAPGWPWVPVGFALLAAGLIAKNN